MEKDVKEGEVGTLVLKQENGIASIEEKLGPFSKQINKYMKVSFQGNLKAELDEMALVGDLIAKYGPSGILGDILKGLEGALAGAELGPAPQA